MSSLPTINEAEEQTDSAGLLDPATGWYRQWYAQLRLSEEIIRANRYKRALAVVTIRLPSDPQTPLNRGALLAALSEIGARELRAIDLPGILGRHAYFVILPETDKAGAKVVARRLAATMGAFAAVIGVADYPKDGKTIEDLLFNARAFKVPPHARA